MSNCIRLAFEYDAKVVILLLMMCFEWLNRDIIVVTTIVDDVGLEFEKICLEWGLQLKNLLEH
jgi:hypothetical protein